MVNFLSFFIVFGFAGLDRAQATLCNDLYGDYQIKLSCVSEIKDNETSDLRLMTISVPSGVWDQEKKPGKIKIEANFTDAEFSWIKSSVDVFTKEFSVDQSSASVIPHDDSVFDVPFSDIKYPLTKAYAWKEIFTALVDEDEIEIINGDFETDCTAVAWDELDSGTEDAFLLLYEINWTKLFVRRIEKETVILNGIKSKTLSFLSMDRSKDLLQCVNDSF